MADYKVELQWDGATFREVLVVDTVLETSRTEPSYDEGRLKGLVGFLEHHDELMRQTGFRNLLPIVLRTVQA